MIGETLNKRKAFSLAEAMIALLLVSLTLAAVAPVITRRQHLIDCFWQPFAQGNGIYYNNGETQQIWPVAIGTSVAVENVPLTISVPTDLNTLENPKISFRGLDTSSGIPSHIEEGEFIFDNRNNMGIGRNILKQNNTSSNNLAL